MLAELAAANAAFAIIKQAVQNGRELADAGSAITKYVGAKEELARRTKKKETSEHGKHGSGRIYGSGKVKAARRTTQRNDDLVRSSGAMVGLAKVPSPSA